MLSEGQPEQEQLWQPKVCKKNVSTHIKFICVSLKKLLLVELLNIQLNKDIALTLILSQCSEKNLELGKVKLLKGTDNRSSSPYSRLLLDGLGFPGHSHATIVFDPLCRVIRLARLRVDINT